MRDIEVSFICKEVVPFSESPLLIRGFTVYSMIQLLTFLSGIITNTMLYTKRINNNDGYVQ